MSRSHTARRLALAAAVIATVSVVTPHAAGYGDEAVPGESLSASDVQILIAQGVDRARDLGVAATIAVADREGNVLGSFVMNGAPAHIVMTAGRANDPDGLEGTRLPLGAGLAAVSKAGTAAYLSSDGNAFTTRTANAIIQENFPPTISSQPGGDLFGVQFSQLPCSDVTANPLPLGLSGDPGGLPIYKNGVLVGGIGIEGDGVYSLDSSTMDIADAPEEDIAVTATRGFEAPATIRADTISIDGMTLPDAASAGAVPQAASSTQDAPQFGFDVSAQVARTAAFFSRPDADARLREAGFGGYVDAAEAEGVKLDGRYAFSSRAIGFLSLSNLPGGQAMVRRHSPGRPMSPVP